MRKLTLLLVFLAISSFGHGQPINPWLADGINNSIARGRQSHDMQGLRDRELQEIAELRRQPFYGAIAMDKNRKVRFSWIGGLETREAVKRRVLSACDSDTCALVAIFSNTCGMVAEPTGNRDVNRVFFAEDKDPERAIDKAYGACEKVFGKGQCRYAERQNEKHTAYCTGYDYGIYSTK